MAVSLPPISIVILSYNCERVLPAAIASVLAQTCSDVDLLIWDDGSTDSSVAIAQRYAQQDGRVRLVAAAHRGKAAAHQAAIAHAQATDLSWVEGRDWVQPQVLDLQLELRDGEFQGTGRYAPPLTSHPAQALARCAGWGLALLPMLLSGLLPWPALAQITSANDGARTVVNQRGDRYTITGGQRSRDGTNLFHSFEQFGLSRDQVANFRSNPAIHNILGRVVGGDASLINGLLQVTGGNANLFLLNPAGIVFGPAARLDVPGSFTATTATGIGFGTDWFSAVGRNDYGALVGNPSSLAFSINQAGAIISAGDLSVMPGNQLSLVGGTVVNTGRLAAPGGEITMLAVPGESLLRLRQTGQILSLDLPVGRPGANLPNAWTLPVATLPALLTGSNLGHATGLQANPDGTISLTGSGLSMPTDGGTVAIAGTVDAAHQGSGQSGGIIQILGRQVGLLDATVTASGHSGGGTILLGGDYQGRGPLPTATATAISPTSTITADAVSLGNGGRVIVWSNEKTLFFGGISARGGSAAGDGGFVEVSGLQHLAFQGTVDTTAPHGTIGTLLLDPLDIIIRSGTGDGNDLNANPFEFTGSPSGTSGQVLAGDTLPTILFESELEATSSAIILQATRNITIDPLADGILSFAPFGGAITFTADADNDGIGTFSMRSTDTLLTGGRDITITGAALQVGNIDATNISAGPAGNITLTARNDISAGDLIVRDTSGGFFGGGDVTVSSQVGDVRVRSIDASGSEGEGGRVTLRGDRVRVTGGVDGPGTPSIDTFGTTFGPVRIVHAGGPQNVPFEIGDASVNGTAGPINNLASGSFPVLPNGGLASGTPARIRIVSVNSPPNLAANTVFSGELDQAIVITFAELAAAITDLNRDITTLIIGAIAPGAELRVNGILVVRGVTVLRPGDQLVYRPPAGSIGVSNAFTLTASDRVSQSNPVQVTVDIGQPPPPPPPPDPDPDLPPSVDVDLDRPLPPPSGANPLPEVGPGRIILDAALTGLEDDLTSQFETYLGLSNTPLKTLDDARDIARQVEEATGEKPAFVYISFLPPSVPVDPVSGLPSPGRLLRQATDELELMVVTAEGNVVRRRVSGATRADVIAMAQRFQQAVTNPRRLTSFDYLPLGQQLYQWIIAPLQADLEAQGITNLVFLPEAGLRSLPFAALHDGQQFLVERYSVGLMPSLSLTDTRYVDIRNAQILAMGVSESVQGQPPLPSVPIELSNLVLELWRGRIFLNDRATLDNLRSIRQTQPFGIIHMATHADFIAGPIGESYIQLWDNRLQLDQLRDLGWNDPAVELLVLSACRTALGDEQAELGFAGLAVQAGVKTAVASLWYVSDAATAALMTRFYESLETAPIKAEALRQAQIAMVRGEVYIENGQLQGLGQIAAFPLPSASLDIGNRQLSHPYYWAAFTMVGNPW